MKKEYIFLILISIMLYLLYLIVDHKYKEYKVNTLIENLEVTNENIVKDIEESKEMIVYLNTNAYKDKLLKETQWLKNKWEEVIHITNQKNYNKYTSSELNINSSSILNEEINKYSEYTNFEKWMIFIKKTPM